MMLKLRKLEIVIDINVIYKVQQNIIIPYSIAKDIQFLVNIFL